MDVVYPLKRSGGPDNELKYSLRSLRNLPHGRVFVVAGSPSWLRDVTVINPGAKRPTKYLDSTANVLAACDSDEVSDPFVLMNDDFFVMQEIEKVPALNRGPVTGVEEELRSKGICSAYLEGMRTTRHHLESLGYEDVLSYELHVPLVVHKSMMRKAIEIGSRFPVWHKRTAYGTLAMLGGPSVPDVKVHTTVGNLPAGPFASTSDKAFALGRAGIRIRARFPDKSPYEP